MLQGEETNYDPSLPRLRRKLTVIGDGACGKTSLLMVQSGLKFPETYVPTMFENFITRIPMKNGVIELSLWDTAGQEEYDRLRPLSYPDTDICIIAFSIASTQTFHSVIEKWYPETTHFLVNVPLLLVGTKVDLRRQPGFVEELAKSFERMVTYEEGLDMAKRIGALRYMEVSAKTGENVRELFEYAAIKAVDPRKKRQSCKML